MRVSATKFLLSRDPAPVPAPAKSIIHTSAGRFNEIFYHSLCACESAPRASGKVFILQTIPGARSDMLPNSIRFVRLVKFISANIDDVGDVYKHFTSFSFR